MAINQTLKIEQGSDWAEGFILTDDDLLPLGTGWTVKAQIKEQSSDVSALYTFSTAAGNAVILDSVLMLSVPSAVSSSWTWRVGVYDLEISNGTSTYRVFTGTVWLSPEVTK